MEKDDFGGINPPPHQIRMEPVACKCGIKHEEGDGNYEFFDLKMTADDSLWQLPPRKTARCKFCKEILLTQRVDS